MKNFPQFVAIHTAKGFSVVNETAVDVFLELSCFFYDPTDVGNLISGSSAFSKSSLNIWKFSVHILLKACLENFEHYFVVFFKFYFIFKLYITVLDLPKYSFENKIVDALLKARFERYCFVLFRVLNNL